MVVDPTTDATTPDEGTAEEEKVALSVIKDITTFLLVADEDTDCTKAQAEWIQKHVTATKQLRVYANADHEFFTWSNQMGFLDNVMVNVSGSASSAVAGFVASTLGLTALTLAASLQ